MSVELRVLGVFIILVSVFLGAIIISGFYKSRVENAECGRLQGVFIRTYDGYTCVKLEVKK